MAATKPVAPEVVEAAPAPATAPEIKPADAAPGVPEVAPSGETPNAAAAPPPDAGQPQPFQLSADHLKIAARAHIDPKSLEFMGKDAAEAWLDKTAKPMLDTVSTAFAEIGRRAQGQKAAPGSPATPLAPTPPVAPPPVAQPSSEMAKLPSSWGFGIDLEGWADPSVENIRQMETATRQGFEMVESRLRAEIESLKSQVQPFVERDRIEGERKIRRVVEGWFKKAEPEFGERYGVGPIENLDPNSEPVGLRKQVAGLAGQIAVGYVQSGQYDSFDEALEDALEAAHIALQKPANPSQENAANRMRAARAAAITPQPGIVPPPAALDPKREAARAQSEWMKKHGLAASPS